MKLSILFARCRVVPFSYQSYHSPKLSPAAVALMPARTKLLSDVGTYDARSIAPSDLLLTKHTCTVPQGATAAEVCPAPYLSDLILSLVS